MKGYPGQYLLVDLTNHKVEPRSMDESMFERFIGGMGVKKEYFIQKIESPKEE